MNSKRPMRRKYERKEKTKGYDDVRRIRYDRKVPDRDYLKFFRVVRYWACRTHEVSLADLEMLFFLYSERLFSRTQFADFEQIMSWDKSRFNRLLRQGWISKWREAKGRECALYEVSFKGKKLIDSIYKKLNGEEKISEDPRNNVMYKNNAPYTDKVYRGVISKMNKL